MYLYRVVDAYVQTFAQCVCMHIMTVRQFLNAFYLFARLQYPAIEVYVILKGRGGAGRGASLQRDV